MQKIFKTEKGSIALFVLLSLLFFLVIVAGVGVSIRNKALSIDKQYEKVKNSYETDVGNEEAVYNEKINGFGNDKNGITIASTSETTPFLPNPSKNEITNNDLSTGLTIKDENQNEWVWIVVPKSANVYKTAGIGQTLPAIPDNSENSIYTKIEADLRKYCETDKDGNTLITQTDGTESTRDYKTTTVGYVDEYVAGKGTNITSADVYKEYKQKMLKSVYENGGFYIGKYETGTETARGASTDELTTAVIKQNAYPYNYVTNAQAEDKAEELKTGGKTTTLLFGIQWDLVLRHLSELGVPTSDLTGDSKEWGNYYYTQPFIINRGEYSQESPWNVFIPYTTATANKVTVTGSGENLVSQKIGTSTSNMILLTTGASDNNSKKNIYDLAGNIWEWTLEKTSYTDKPCSLRGGVFYNAGSSSPASGRNDFYSTSYSGNTIGFRVSLY